MPRPAVHEVAQVHASATFIHHAHYTAGEQKFVLIVDYDKQSSEYIPLVAPKLKHKKRFIPILPHPAGATSDIQPNFPSVSVCSSIHSKVEPNARCC